MLIGTALSGLPEKYLHHLALSLLVEMGQSLVRRIGIHEQDWGELLFELVGKQTRHTNLVTRAPVPLAAHIPW